MSRFDDWPKPDDPDQTERADDRRFRRARGRARNGRCRHRPLGAQARRSAGSTRTWSGSAAPPTAKSARRSGLLVAHFFNHQTHHRGQAHAMLTAAGQQTGDTDLFLLVPADRRLGSDPPVIARSACARRGPLAADLLPGRAAGLALALRARLADPRPATREPQQSRDLWRSRVTAGRREPDEHGRGRACASAALLGDPHPGHRARRFGARQLDRQHRACRRSPGRSGRARRSRSG